MIKKITLTLILFCMIVSCGKKGNPKYKDPEKKAETQTILINNA
jgi:hypothetical protein|tara:strand:- start:43 stop:174 length:132 start_codon:yes stop_codon:yes gene_type:complete